jgi:hypothetical protein
MKRFSKMWKFAAREVVEFSKYVVHETVRFALERRLRLAGYDVFMPGTHGFSQEIHARLYEKTDRAGNVIRRALVDEDIDLHLRLRNSVAIDIYRNGEWKNDHRGSVAGFIAGKTIRRLMHRYRQLTNGRHLSPA